jgi:hypothetical protein
MTVAWLFGRLRGRNGVPTIASLKDEFRVKNAVDRTSYGRNNTPCKSRGLIGAIPAVALVAGKLGVLRFEPVGAAGSGGYRIRGTL